MMGVYGMLAMGLALFCLRYLIPAERWPERRAKISFWSTNIGLAWMRSRRCCHSGSCSRQVGRRRLLRGAQSGLPAGCARCLTEWLRLPGDAVLILGGVLPLIYLCWLSLRHMVPLISEKKAEVSLFTDISEMAERQP